MDYLVYFFFLNTFIHCHGVSVEEQLKHIVRRRQENEVITKNNPLFTRRLHESLIMENLFPTRRGFDMDSNNVGAIIGVPSKPSHLPEAEPILPGHTLIRPSLGMLKSAIKFPMRELDDGAGVYGNLNNIGLKWDGRNERLLNSVFRRNMADDPDYRRLAAEYLMLAPAKKKYSKPSYSLSNMLLDLDQVKDTENKILKRLKTLRQPPKNNNKLVLYVAQPDKAPLLWNRLLGKNNQNLIQIEKPKDVFVDPIISKTANGFAIQKEDLKFNLFDKYDQIVKQMAYSRLVDFKDNSKLVPMRRSNNVLSDLTTEPANIVAIRQLENDLNLYGITLPPKPSLMTKLNKVNDITEKSEGITPIFIEVSKRNIKKPHFHTDVNNTNWQTKAIKRVNDENVNSEIDPYNKLLKNNAPSAKRYKVNSQTDENYQSYTVPSVTKRELGWKGVNDVWDKVKNAGSIIKKGASEAVRDILRWGAQKISDVGNVLGGNIQQANNKADVINAYLAQKHKAIHHHPSRKPQPGSIRQHDSKNNKVFKFANSFNFEFNKDPSDDTVMLELIKK